MKVTVRDFLDVLTMIEKEIVHKAELYAGDPSARNLQMLIEAVTGMNIVRERLTSAIIEQPVTATPSRHGEADGED